MIHIRCTNVRVYVLADSAICSMCTFTNHEYVNVNGYGGMVNAYDEYLVAIIIANLI